MKTVEQRFWAKVEKLPGPNACWLWKKRSARGYGSLNVGGKYVTASRLSLEMKLGRPLLPGMEACHTCDTRGCVRPEHLWEGTKKQNMADARAKGRNARGEKHGNAKYSDELVAVVRQRVEAGASYAEAARVVGVSRHYVWNVCNGKRLELN